MFSVLCKYAIISSLVSLQLHLNFNWMSVLAIIDMYAWLHCDVDATPPDVVSVVPLEPDNPLHNCALLVQISTVLAVLEYSQPGNHTHNNVKKGHGL